MVLGKLLKNLYKCLFLSFITSSLFPLHVSAKGPKYADIVIDAHTGEVLEAFNEDSIRHPASLTKIMALYMAFEALKDGRLAGDAVLVVSKHAARQEPCKLGLRVGEKISVESAIKGIVTKSANDASVVVAEHLAGTEAAFAQKMTQKAKQLGMNKTVFKNASGLPNAEQVTTARDMAILARSIYRDFPKEYAYFKLKSFSHKGMVHNNHNHLLGKVHGVDGIKTGFTFASGFNLVASAVRHDKAGQPHRLIAVVLGGENRHWRDRRVTELLESNFTQRGIGNIIINKKASKKIDILQEIALSDSKIASRGSVKPAVHKVRRKNAFSSIEGQKNTVEDEVLQVLKAIEPNVDKQPQAQELSHFINSLQEEPQDKPTLIAATSRPANWIVSTPKEGKKNFVKIKNAKKKSKKASPKRVKSIYR